jgi:competence protein ComEC
MEELKITFLNVGYGEAVLVRCGAPARPGGAFTLLVDGGSAEASEYADRTSGRIRLSEYLARHPLDHLDVLVSTHPHEDHVSGLADLSVTPGELWQTFPPSFWREAPELPESAAVTASDSKFTRGFNDCRRLCLQTAARGGAVRQMAASREAVPLCPGLTARVLGPSGTQCQQLVQRCRVLFSGIGGPDYLPALRALDAAMNNFSLILLLEYGRARILLSGDANAAGFAGISGDIRADLFKMGHHGQKDAVTATLAERVAPVHAVCCASSDRRYESASPAALHLLSDAGTQLWFSDCPPGYGLAPHSALEFSVRPDGAVRGEYQSE